MRAIRKTMEWIQSLFLMRCPKCGKGRLHYTNSEQLLTLEIDTYTCDKCNGEMYQHNIVTTINNHTPK